MSDVSAQEVFNRVAAHLLTQAAKSCEIPPAGGLLSCLYRTSKGLKCAVGCLIEDADYHIDMEGHGIHSISPLSEWLAAGPGARYAPHMRLLVDLQLLHDASDVRAWPENLRQLAAMRRLSAEVVDRLEEEFVDRIQLETAAV